MRPAVAAGKRILVADAVTDEDLAVLGALLRESEASRSNGNPGLLPAGAGGVFVQGGTLGNLSALVAAREAARDRLEAVRESDAILREEFANAGLEGKVWQYFTAVPAGSATYGDSP